MSLTFLALSLAVTQPGPVWMGHRQALKANGSSAGDAIGVGFNSRIEIYRRKVLQQHPEYNVFTKERFAHGHGWEDTALHLTMQVLQIPLHQLYRCGIALDRDLIGLGATPDGLIPTHDAVVEIKCPYPKAGQMVCWQRWGQIPPKYLVQIMCEMHATGAKRCYLACMGVEEAGSYKFNPHTGQFQRQCHQQQFYQARLAVWEFEWNQVLWDEVVSVGIRKFMQYCRQRSSPPAMKHGAATQIKKRLQEWAPKETLLWPKDFTVEHQAENTCGQPFDRLVWCRRHLIFNSAE